MIIKVAKLLEDSARHFGISTMNPLSMQLIEQAKLQGLRLTLPEDTQSEQAFMNNNYTNADCSERPAVHLY